MTHRVVTFCALLAVLTCGCATSRPDSAAGNAASSPATQADGTNQPADALREDPDREAPSLGNEDYAASKALARYCMGLIVQEGQGPAADALVEFERAAALDPARPQPSVRAATVCLQTREYDRALAILRPAIDRNPKDEKLLLLRANAYQLKGDLDGALRAYEHLVRVVPSATAGYAGVASVYLSRKNDKKALEVLRAAAHKLDKLDTLAEVCESLIKQYTDSGRLNEAAECLRILTLCRPHDLSVAVRLLAYCTKTGQFHEAQEVFRDAMRWTHDKAMAMAVLKYLADDCVSSDQSEAAAACLELILEYEPEHVAARLRLMGYRLLDNDKRGADSLRRAAPDALRNDPVFTYGVARVCVLGREFAAAIAAFDETEALLKKQESAETAAGLRDSTYSYYRGAAYDGAGQCARAESLFENAISLSPSNHPAYNHLAYMWAEQGTNLARAETYVMKALVYEPQSAAYIDTLGWIQYKQGRLEPAETQLRKAIELQPGDATMLDHLGDVLDAMGKSVEALDLWKRSYRIEPSNKAVAAKLRAHHVNLRALLREAAAEPKRDSKTAPPAAGASQEGN